MSEDKKFVTTDEFEAYKKEARKEFGVKKPKTTRAPNEYNLYMKEKVAELKTKNSSLTNQEAFKLGAASWGEHKKSKEAK